MKNTWIIARIVLSLVAIFALGIWVGRMTTPAPEPFDVEMESDDQTTPSNLNRVTRRAMMRYQNGLGLSDEKMALLRPAFENVTLRMVDLPKASEARVAVIKDFHEEIAPHLTDEQRNKTDEILETMEARNRE